MLNKIDYGNNMLCMQLLWAERTDRCCCTTSVTGACPLCHSSLFDLQGRRLSQKPARGVYIQGGMKRRVR